MSEGCTSKLMKTMLSIVQVMFVQRYFSFISIFLYFEYFIPDRQLHNTILQNTLQNIYIIYSYTELNGVFLCRHEDADYDFSVPSYLNVVHTLLVSCG